MFCLCIMVVSIFNYKKILNFYKLRPCICSKYSTEGQIKHLIIEIWNCAVFMSFKCCITLWSSGTEFVVVEDSSCLDTNAIILKGTTVLTYKPRLLDRPFSGSLAGIEVLHHLSFIKNINIKETDLFNPLRISVFCFWYFLHSFCECYKLF